MGKPQTIRETKAVPKALMDTSAVKSRLARKRESVMAGLRKLNCPKVVALLCGLIFSLPGLGWEELDHVELFSGGMAVTIGEREEGRKAAAFDIEYDSLWMDLNTPQGFVLALYQVMRLRPGASLTLAPVCSTWVFMSRGSTHRSKCRPLGDESVPSVCAGNIMVARCSLLCMVASALGIWWVLEQPRGSLLQYHPAILRLFKTVQVVRQHIRMGQFAADTEKGTWLYSSRPEIEELYDFRPVRLPVREKTELVRHYVDGKGKKRITGNSQLKKSQRYPIQFGRALARLRTRHHARLLREAKAFLKDAKHESEGKKDVPTMSGLSWWMKHAKLEDVFQYLS